MAPRPGESRFWRAPMREKSRLLSAICANQPHYSDEILIFGAKEMK
jgi:hypothetical protein